MSLSQRDFEARIRTLEKEIEGLKRRTGNLPVRFGGGQAGTGTFVLHVENFFPAIPTEGTEFLLHTTHNQLFHAHSTYTEWRPLESWFAGTGEPTFPGTGE